MYYVTGNEAIEISKRRFYKDTGAAEFANGRRKNTVFAKAQAYIRCITDDPECGDLIISQHPVLTLHCEKANSYSGWTFELLGEFHSIFDARTGHFPGHLYMNVFFP